MATLPELKLQKLYEIDEDKWLEETINLLKYNSLDKLDLENLIKELEDLGKERRNRVASLLEQIIRHLLLLEYWTTEYEFNSNHWEVEIINFRNQINWGLTTNLKIYLEKNKEKIYQNALRYVRKKTQGKITNLPDNCPYSLEQLLDDNWLLVECRIQN